MTDDFKIIFTAENVNGVINAHLQLARAQDTINATATAAATKTATVGQNAKAAIPAVAGLTSSLQGMAIQSAAAVAGIVKLEDSYLKFANAVMNVRDLTGSSAKEATQATVLARVAGMPDATALREILKSSAAAFKGEGQVALSELGVIATPNESGLKLINDIANALQRIPDGLRKAEIEERLFGARGVAAIQPLLRLTQQQREETMRLADDFDTTGLAAAQQMSYSFNLLGQTILQDFVYPIAEQLLPLIQGMVTGIIDIVNAWHQVDQLFHGIPSFVVGFLALSASILTVVRTITALQKAYEALIAVEAIADALSGPAGWAKLAVGAAVAGVGVYGLSKAFGGNANESSNDPATKFSQSVDRFGAHVVDMEDAVSQLKGNGIPRGLNTYDVNALSQSAALKTIG